MKKKENNESTLRHLRALLIEKNEISQKINLLRRSKAKIEKEIRDIIRAEK